MKKETHIADICMTHASMFYMDTTLSFYRDGEMFLGELQIKLMKQVMLDGSIHAASKNLKMSYQHAWHLLDKVNSLSPIPVVIRQKGGKDGGGCHISPYGKKLMDMYEKRTKELESYIRESNIELSKHIF